ncbi:MAG: hypothetical protein IJA26_01995, partial [Clostridia bacterium]|nr:hypothetical protein [Clostridia bacterium]
MGSFFTSICAQVSKSAARSALRAAMLARGYRTDNKTPEISFSIAPCGGKWCCIKGEQMDFDDFEGFIADFSDHLQTAVLTAECFDSDCLYLTLHKNGETDAACAGMPYDDDPPEPNPEFWQDAVGDFDAFTEILQQERVFYEEALLPLGELMGFDGNALLPTDEPVENAICMGFSRAKVKENPLVTSGPAKLGHVRGQKPNPYRLDSWSTIIMHNFGGPSKGIKIIIEAAYPEGRDLPFEISEALLRSKLSQDIDMCQAPAEFKCISREGGCIRMEAALPDFEIPAGINLNYTHPSSMKQMETDFAQNFVFNFQLNIPEHLDRLDISFIPLEYPEGAYTWRLQDCWITPQELEIF